MSQTNKIKTFFNKVLQLTSRRSKEITITLAVFGVILSGFVGYQGYNQTQSKTALAASGNIVNSDITSTSCTPLTGTNIFTLVTCKVNFAAGKTGTVTFTANTNNPPIIPLGGCTTVMIVTSDTSAQCDFYPSTGPASNTTLIAISQASNAGAQGINNQSNTIQYDVALCLPGRYPAPACTVCPANNWCPGSTPRPCPIGQIAPLGSGYPSFCNSNSATLDKYYKYNGVESQNATIGAGTQIEVIIKYNNKGNQSMTDAQIKDTLPPGFNYVSGSMTNCLIPSNSEVWCDGLNTTDKDTLFNTLNSTGVSPIAGLYDIPASNQSNYLLFGKKRYIDTLTCSIPTSGFESFTSKYNTSGTPVSQATAQDCINETNGTISDNTVVDTIGKRYSQNVSCNIPSWTPASTDLFGRFFNNSATSTYSNGDCITANGGGISFGYVKDTLDKRFLQRIICSDQSSNLRDDFVIDHDNTGVNVNGTSGANSCVTSKGPGSVMISTGTEDSLDNTRGEGYLTYKMQSPYAAGTFGTTSTLRSAVQTGVNPIVIPINDTFVNGSNNMITTVLSTVIGATNLGTGSCTPTTAPAGTTISCSYPLSGDASNQYTLPFSGITGTISGGTAGNSPACTVVNNSTASATLVCASIPTSGIAPGSKTVILNNVAPSPTIPVTITTGSGTSASSSANSSASSTTASVGTKLNLKAYLAGPADSGSSKMKTLLKNNNLVPVAQPYNIAGFSYSGSEAFAVSTSIPSTCVDWVLLEIKPSSGTSFKKAVWVDENGNLYDAATPTASGVDLGSLATGSYNVILRHRNHLAISTNTAITITSGSTTTLDLSGNANVKGSNQTLLFGSTYGLRLGNPNGDADILGLDRAIVRAAAEVTGYLITDINLDGTVDSLDRALQRNAPESSELLN